VLARLFRSLGASQAVHAQSRLQPDLDSNARPGAARTLQFAIDHSNLVDVNSSVHSRAFHWFAPFFLLALARADAFQKKQL
jgi:hypothetical protein